MISTSRRGLALAVLGAALVAVLLGVGCPESPDDVPSPLVLTEPGRVLPLPRMQRWTGDLPGIRQRRVLRVLVSYSPTNFAIVEGRRRGFEAELMEQYEAFLNRNAPRRDQRIEVAFVPVSFDRLLPSLLAGWGDVAAAGLTVTPERRRQVAFTEPYLTDVAEVVVGHAEGPPLATLDDLDGHTVHVVSGSSYAESLERLDRRLRAAGGTGVEVVEVDRHLEVHDVLEMVNAGVLELTVADDHIARLWSQVLPELVVYDRLEVASGGDIAWAVRPASPELLASLDRFIAQNRRGTLLGNVLFKRYYQGTRWITNPVSPAKRRQLAELRGYFEKYGERYRIDWRLLAAQAFQESGLDPRKVSPAGAVGVMQLRPSTAADPAIGIADVYDPESNIHAGAKYLAHLRDTYFDDDGLEPAARLHFSLAAYNAGPDRVRRLRREAARRGLDPDEWFSNVEQVALDEVGAEPVTYVANILKYYVAYQLSLTTLEQREEEKRRVHAEGAAGR